MQRILFTLLTILVLGGCDGQGKAPPAPEQPAGKALSLSESRQGFATKLVQRKSAKTPVAAPSNDQSASAFRTKGIPMMFPSLRGGNDNPGVQESFFGEVDDVLAVRHRQPARV